MRDLENLLFWLSYEFHHLFLLGIPVILFQCCLFLLKYLCQNFYYLCQYLYLHYLDLPQLILCIHSTLILHHLYILFSSFLFLSMLVVHQLVPFKIEFIILFVDIFFDLTQPIHILMV